MTFVGIPLEIDYGINHDLMCDWTEEVGWDGGVVFLCVVGSGGVIFLVGGGRVMIVGWKE